MNNGNTWIYNQVVKQINKAYSEKRSVRSIIINLWTNDHWLIYYPIIYFVSALSFGMILTWIVQVIQFLMQKGLTIHRSATLIAIIELILIVIAIISIVKLERLSHNTQVSFKEADKLRVDREIFTKIYRILREYKVDNIVSMTMILDESERIIQSYEQRFEKYLSYVSKLMVLLVVAPIGFLMSLGFSLESRNNDELKYVEEILNFVPLCAVIMMVFVALIFLLIVMIHSDLFLNFLFYERKGAILVKSYVGTLIYEDNLINEFQGLSES